MPPMVTVFPPTSIWTATSFSFVSVVMMALADLVPLSRLPSRAGAIIFTPATILSMGSCMPITPVDATRTPSAETPKISAAASAVALQYPYPSSPVHALAIPAFMITAWALSEWYTTCWSHFTGAAFTIFVVNVPAATHGFSLYIMAMSVLSLYLIPAAAEADLNPFGAVTPPSISFIFSYPPAFSVMWARAAWRHLPGRRNAFPL